MKKIKLTQDKYALVDDSDYEELNKHKWYAAKHGNTYYVRRNSKVINGKSHTIRMHILLMKPFKGKEVDHKDGNGLNNQKENLRIVTHLQNSQNRIKNKNNKSGFKGVHLYENNGIKKWVAQITVNNRQKNLGYFNSKLEAYNIYCKACIKYHKKYAKIK